MNTQIANIENSMVVKVWNKTFIPCETLAMAAKIVRSWIDQKDIETGDMGGRRWCNKTNGNIYDHSGKVVARISYNGRIWALDGKEIIA